jgi:hypothetical protein
MIIWVANYWTSHCLSFNYFFPYIFGPTVYDLLALAANPNHPALQHTDAEVNLHVKLNEFGQGTQIVSLPEVRARTVPDAVSDVGTMSPLMFCAAISSANLVSIAYRIQYTFLVLFNRDPLQKKQFIEVHYLLLQIDIFI